MKELNRGRFLQSNGALYWGIKFQKDAKEVTQETARVLTTFSTETRIRMFRWKNFWK